MADASLARRFVVFARNSPWFLIAVALHVIVAAVLALVVVGHQREREADDGIVLAVHTTERPPVPLAPPEPPSVRNAVPQDQIKELAATEVDLLPFETQEADLHEEPGDPKGLDPDVDPGRSSTSTGVSEIHRGHRGRGPSSVAGHGEGNGPAGPRKGRHPSHELEITENAVLEGLRWLLRHQSPDGSWTPAGVRARCDPRNPCIGDDVELVPYYDEGLTALALLAFLGSGIGIDSRLLITDTAMGVQHPAGERVKAAVKWLLDAQKEDGSFSAARPFLYNEALATMALAEAHALSPGLALRRAAQKGVDFLVAAQKRGPDGAQPWGWRYAPRGEAEEAAGQARARLAELEQERTAAAAALEGLEAGHVAGSVGEGEYVERAARLRDELQRAGRESFEARSALDAAQVDLADADLSVTTWVVFALEAARRAGLDVPDGSLQGALAFARHVTGEDGAVGYQDPRQAGLPIAGPGDAFVYHTGTMTALGMCVRTFVARDADDPFLLLGARRIARDPPEVSPDRLSVDYYYWYYATLALNQLDGPDSPRRSGGAFWTPWNKALVGVVLGLQDRAPASGACSRGGWLADDRWSHAGHALYNTALDVLTLEVYYRYENAFGRPRRER